MEGYVGANPPWTGQTDAEPGLFFEGHGFKVSVQCMFGGRVR